MSRMSLKKISVAEVENVAHTLAQELMGLLWVYQKIFNTKTDY